MKVSQIYEIMNTITKELLGDEPIVLEDLSNIVDIGKAIIDTNNLDNYVRKLVDHIGKVVVVDRVYRGRAPSVLMDGWEYGSILEKISIQIPEAEANESWELVDGSSYDPNIFRGPKVSAKFFDSRITFEIPMSFAQRQVKSAFSNAVQLNAFISGIYNAIQKSMTVKTDALIARTINNFIGETLWDAYQGTDFTGVGNARAVNLLAMYNAKVQPPAVAITAEQAITDPDFIRFAAMTMGNYVDRLKVLSGLFNIDGNDRFTDPELLHIVMLSEFKNAANAYLQSDTFHDEYTALPNAELVPYWQGPGESYEFSATSAIHIKTASNNEVQASGILAVMFDRDALGVTNIDPRVTSQWNAKAEFFNEWHKWDAGYFNDTGENFVVFFVA